MIDGSRLRPSMRAVKKKETSSPIYIYIYTRRVQPFLLPNICPFPTGIKRYSTEWQGARTMEGGGVIVVRDTHTVAVVGEQVL